MDPFARLGVEPKFSVDLVELERVHRELSATLHPDRHVQALPAERRRALEEAVEVNEAWRVLRDPIRRAEALLGLRGAANSGEGAGPSIAFLQEMLERREELEAARRGGPALRDRLAREVSRAFDATRDALAGALDSGAAGGSSPGVLLAELRFHRRLLDEIASLEDD